MLDPAADGDHNRNSVIEWKRRIRGQGATPFSNKMTYAGQPPLTSVSLLSRLRKPGDDAAWRTFVDLYTPLIYRYCQRRGLQDADAKDVAQEVLTQVSQAIRTFKYDPARGRFRGWLGAVVSNAIARHAARLGRAGRGQGNASGAFAFDEIAAEADPLWIEEFKSRVLQSALARIRIEFDETTWRAFELIWLAGGKPQDVATALEKPVAWIYKAKSRVLSRLKEQVLYLTADIAFFARP